MRLDSVTKLVRFLPESADEPHDDWTSFKVRGKRFASATPDERSLHLAVDDDETRACVAEDPDAFEEWWTGKSLCLRVDLEGAKPARVRELIMEAWLRKAPKRVAATLDDRGKDG
ncbi:MAG: MmcQ/YjbR family DNA-binding protein [Acidimicrobiia bacterium]